MIELVTGTGLAMAAGLNAYIPLLALGLAARFLGIVALPPAWATQSVADPAVFFASNQ